MPLLGQHSDLCPVLAQSRASGTPWWTARMTKPEQAFYGHLFTTHNINHTGMGARRSRQEINKDPEPLSRAELLRDTPRAHLTPPPAPPGPQMALSDLSCSRLFLEGAGGSAGPRRLSHLPPSTSGLSLRLDHEGSTRPLLPQVCKSLKWGWQALLRCGDKAGLCIINIRLHNSEPSPQSSPHALGETPGSQSQPHVLSRLRVLSGHLTSPSFLPGPLGEPRSLPRDAGRLQGL